jgi:hypothetical protein
MSERTPISGCKPDFQAAGREFGTSAVITQWSKDGKVRHQVSCLRLGQIALSDTMLFVLEGEKVQGWVYLADIRRLAIESRRSYKHPIIGSAIGLAFMAAPVSVVLGDPFSIAGYFGGDLFLFTGGFIGLIGAYTFYEAVLSRKVPWLIVDTATAPRALMFTERLTPAQEALIAAMGAAVAPQEKKAP